MSNTRESVVDAAARWYARVHAPDCTGRDREAFENWLRANPDHWHAYADAERTVRRFDQLIEQDDRLCALADEVCGESTAPSRRRWAVPAALAASLIVALVAVRVAGVVEHSSPAEVFVTRVDEQRDVTLADNSVVHLDVGSEIAVNIGDRERAITLTRGRALFDVAKDRERPFVVTAGGTRTTALGTKFQVQSDSERVVVVLTEGSVSVAPLDTTAEAARWEERLAPGEQISLQGKRSAPVKSSVDTYMATSWSRGRLVFRGTPLAEALEEVNRYSTRKLRLADPSLASLPVGGNFIAGDSELILSAFAAALPLRSVDGGGGEILLFRRYESDPL
ncbi:MAG TPA: FecR family protein [Steroidobacteraceae bacterium]|nr:FecR family protein [Steroidobacteraceae bacterium]